MRRGALLTLALSLLACAQTTNPRDRDAGGIDATPGPVDAGPGRDAARPDGGPEGTDAGPPRPCTAGCGPLERCVDGLCAPYPPCAGDGSCGPSEICQRRVCLPAAEDLDGDGSVAAEDCDESDPAIHPGATEICDGVDQDCDSTVDEGVGPRDCSTACEMGTESCVMGAWASCTARSPTPETCNGIDDDCDSSVDEDLTRPCSSACGAGTETCSAGAWVGCTARAPSAETCNGIDDDCDSSVDEGLARACSTACGSGNETCAAGIWGACDAPPVVTETCDLTDQDCDGVCDDVPGGCRQPVHRSYKSSSGEHFYSTSRTEAACCGFGVEFYDYYYLYRTSNPAVRPFYRCVLSTGFHFYTKSATCEGSPGARLEGTMGYAARSAGACGSVPLYRLVRGNDHFYTVSASERDSAVAGGYRSEGVAAYVWTAP